MNQNLTPRLNRTLAELEYDLWESIINREITLPCDLEFGFVVRHQEIAHRPLEENVEVKISIRQKS